MLRAILVGLLLGASTFFVPAPAAHCSPPCGPVPVLITITLEKFRGLTFGDESKLVLPGTVSYYVNVDQDGYWFDPQHRPIITFKVNRQAPWVQTSVDPSSYEVPLDDPQYLKPEGSNPGDLQWYWEAPLTVTVLKLRDPTQEELSGRWLRSDGTYRASISASATASMVGGDVLGTPMGAQEGYGVRELRFTPEGLSDAGTLGKSTGAEAPGMAAWMAFAALVFVVGAGLRRRRA